jgi:alcohol dehydrogenase class IV
MSYAVAGLVKEYRPSGYPQIKPIIPHGMSVILNAPACVRFTAPACPERHLEAAQLLGGKQDATPSEAGAVLAERLTDLMKAAGMPNGLCGVGYTDQDIQALTAGAFPQQRLLRNAPCAVSKEDLAQVFQNAMEYW